MSIEGTKAIYLIHPVRGATEESMEFCDRYVAILEEAGHKVYYPIRDNPYEKVDETGAQIMSDLLAGMIACDEVHIYWDPESTGSKVDLGMAHALHKPIVIVMMEVDKKKRTPNFETFIEDWPWKVRDRRRK